MSSIILAAETHRAIRGFRVVSGLDSGIGFTFQGPHIWSFCHYQPSMHCTSYVSALRVMFRIINICFFSTELNSSKACPYIVKSCNDYVTISAITRQSYPLTKSHNLVLLSACLVWRAESLLVIMLAFPWCRLYFSVSHCWMWQSPRLWLFNLADAYRRSSHVMPNHTVWECLKLCFLCDEESHFRLSGTTCTECKVERVQWVHSHGTSGNY